MNTTLLIDLIGAVVYPIVQYILYRKKEKKKNYKFVRDFNTSNIVEVKISPILGEKFDKVDRDKLNPHFKKIIMDFTKILEEKVPRDYLTNFYNNINRASIGYDYNWAGLCRKWDGYYNDTDNILRISPSAILNLKGVIYHELLHLASSKCYVDKSDASFVGFHQKGATGGIGVGLNEGYTEYLTRKHFEPQAKASSSYNYLANIMMLVEKIVGNDMEKYYFNADLLGLINELKKYSSTEEIYQFINNCDLIYKYFGKDSKLYKEQKHMIENILKQINKFLIKCYYIKLNMSREQNIDGQLVSFLQAVPRKANSAKRNYDIMNDEDISSFIYEVQMTLVNSEDMHL